MVEVIIFFKGLLLLNLSICYSKLIISNVETNLEEYPNVTFNASACALGLEEQQRGLKCRCVVKCQGPLGDKPKI